MQSFFQPAATTIENEAQPRRRFVHDDAWLKQIESADRETLHRWQNRLTVQPALSRALVSFQASRDRSVYRWFKFKEAFSPDLVDYLLQTCGVAGGRLLDPFAGSGTALFAASQRGMAADGIELLPIGQSIIQTKQIIDSQLTPADIRRLEHWRDHRPWERHRGSQTVNELRITHGAYSRETHDAIGRFLHAAAAEDHRVQTVLRFALLCILEQISFTRKDGQYLRWDYRSGRSMGKKRFDKGLIPAFTKAMTGKLNDIVSDLSEGAPSNHLFEIPDPNPNVRIHCGSCLNLLQEMDSRSFDCVLTSPPYCNRYDYTRTYALELALLGTDEPGLRGLRQEMLSCTVENRAKELEKINPKWRAAIQFVADHALLQSILNYLESQRERDQLNNNGIPRMVRGYFSEMACVIAECARILKPGSPLIMVNDNVRYAGASVSVDLILSEIAEKLDLTAERILVLPGGKGNSSQQMGVHGREPLRKCVYIWRKN
jgi:DNA modification methylase